MTVGSQVNTHKQEIDIQLMKYRINSLKTNKGVVYVDKLASGTFNPTCGDKYTLKRIEQVSSVDGKTMKITFEMEFVNE